MEISSTIVERALDGVNSLALPVAGASCLYLMLRERGAAVAFAVSRRRRRRRSRLLRRGIGLLGLLLSVPTPAVAGARRIPPGSARATFGVRMEPGGFPPPRLPGSAEPPIRVAGVLSGADVVRGPDVRSGGEGPPRVHVDRPGSVVHVAIHGGDRSGVNGPLFRRWHAAPPPGAHTAMHGAGAPDRWHAVLPGETLWSIAAARLRTDDVRRIARYWPRIHRANRDEIGPNPNLIRPGQVLELPPEHA